MGSCWSGDGGASWCIQLGRTAIHFPQLVIYGTAKQREAGVRGTRPSELVHCPASSCFTTQRAGLPNLRWQTVTYITPRLPNEDWWCLKGSVYTVDFTHMLLSAQRCTKERILFFFPSPSLWIWSFMLHFCTFFLFSLISIFFCRPLSQYVNVMWSDCVGGRASVSGPAPEDCALLFRETGGGHSR